MSDRTETYREQQWENIREKGWNTMPRTNLKKAREKADLTQQELAELIGAERKAVISWEAGTQDPQPGQRRNIRQQLNNYDEYLFAIASQEASGGVHTTPPCSVPRIRVTVNDTDPHLFDFDIAIQGSNKGLKKIMELLRRQLIDALAKISGLSLLSNVSLAFVSSPVIAPEEYLAQCRITIDACWEWLNSGNFQKVASALQVNVPTLARLANTISPLQSIAASLAVEAKIMHILLTTHQLDYASRKLHCLEAVRFGELSGERNLRATALSWQGNTFIYCYRQPQTAIPILTDALIGLDTDASLLKSAIYSDLSIAHAQDTTQEKYEAKARDYAELAHLTIPSHPELDPLYQCINLGQSELDQAEGKMYLYLAAQFPTSDYARKAYDTFAASADKKALNRGYSGALLIKKADAARALGELRDFVTCLSEGLLIAIETDNKNRISEAHDVLHRIPQQWHRETAIRTLQKEVTQAIIVARR
jgi:transcriptional regulator with XRE-family HTH domain